MGAWGAGPFENDSAMELVRDYEDLGLAALMPVLIELVEADEYLDRYFGAGGVAAGEIIAACHGAPLANVPDVLMERLKKHCDAVLSDAGALKIARSAISDKLLDPEMSETADSWAVAAPEDNAAFQASVENLQARLAKVGK